MIALLLGMVTMRLSGHFLPLGTIAWGLSLFFLFGNLEFLGKYDGIRHSGAHRMASRIRAVDLLPDLGGRVAIGNICSESA
ncbi:MAG: ABC transporter, permease protein 2 (cluster 4, leucine/isoleucine/valine/benzoate) / ABC transporter, ATP-binding protein 1 (cluster 4, leucine/isoleucine/valine/benzoate) [uncultured Caballeronia sp.]|nr:MAG: ABC transporter, permease protein 2 (cluster 4, leucine/isoleucine/valine/benzoate) / ABC transporter, ATP-binding protein 1 (cluster 4, leucine/isoleucine/valine/benzoate) [uncultured Caballeronia sp.]